MCVCVCLSFGLPSIYLSINREKSINKIIQEEEEFDMKESRSTFHVSVLMNHHQDEKGWYLAMLKYCWMFNRIQKGGNTMCRERGNQFQFSENMSGLQHSS